MSNGPMMPPSAPPQTPTPQAPLTSRTPPPKRGIDWGRLVVRWLVISFAVVVAAWLVPGIEYSSFGAVLLFSIILALVNAFVRPLLAILSCPIIVLTLGLFVLVINALMLMLAGWISETFGVGLTVDGFWSAFWGALIISIVSWLIGIVLPDKYEA